MSSRNTNLIIGAVIAITGLFLAGCSSDSDTATDAASAISDDGEGKAKASLNDLLGKKKNLKCTYSSTESDGSKTSGTTYMAGDKRVRTIGTTTPTGQATETWNTLSDGDYTYMWKDGATEGTKYKATESTTTTTTKSDATTTTVRESTTTTETVVDQNEAQDFDCQKWTVDESLLKPPSNVNFIDFAAQMEALKQSTTTIDRAAICAQLEGDARTMCEANT